MLLKDIKINPKNPRVIKDGSFKRLVKSIQEFPQMMSLRPLVLDDQGIILGGNQRYAVLKHLKYKEIPDEWVKRASDLTEDQKKRFILADNVTFGDWDQDILNQHWTPDEQGLVFSQDDIVFDDGEEEVEDIITGNVNKIEDNTKYGSTPVVNDTPEPVQKVKNKIVVEFDSPSEKERVISFLKNFNYRYTVTD